MSALVYIVLALVTVKVISGRKRKPDPTLGGRLIPRGAYQPEAPARTQPATAAAPFTPRYPKMSNLMWYAPPGTVNLETGEWL